MAFRFLLTVALVASVALGQNIGDSSSRFNRIPGARTAAEILASSADGTSRYLAPDGPIQPAITAISGLPVRAAEQANRGITRISSGLRNQAQSLSRAAGDGGNIRMPGMDTLESRMPEPLRAVGEQLQGAIRGKNNFIRGQADQAAASMTRLRDSMHGSASSLDLLTKGHSVMQSQMQQHMSGVSDGINKVRGLGENLLTQAQGIHSTVQSGAQGALSQLQRTGQSVMSQLQNNHARNTNQMSNMFGSMRNSMGSSLDGLKRSAQSAVEQVQGGLQRAAQMPMELLSNFGNMVSSGSGGGKSAGRY